MNRFIQGGRLADSHKNNINTHELITKLNKTAKEKVNETRRKQKKIYL